MRARSPPDLRARSSPDDLRAKLVPRRGLEPPRPCERQHLKLVRLPIPPPGHRGLSFWQAAALRGAPRLPCQSRKRAAIAPPHDRADGRACDRLRRRRIHRPLRLRIPVQEGRAGPRRQPRSAPGLFHPAARRRSGSSGSTRPTSPNADSVRNARQGRDRGRSTCAACSAARCGRSMSTARATSPRRRATRARRRWSTSRRSAPSPNAQSDYGRTKGEGEAGGPRSLPGRDDHPPVAGVRARGRAHQPLRRHGAACRSSR